MNNSHTQHNFRKDFDTFLTRRANNVRKLRKSAAKIESLASKSECAEMYTNAFTATGGAVALGALATFAVAGTGGAAAIPLMLVGGKVAALGSAQGTVVKLAKAGLLKRRMDKLKLILENDKELMESLSNSLKPNINLLSDTFDLYSLLHTLYSLGKDGIYLDADQVTQNMETIQQISSLLHGHKTDLSGTTVDTLIGQIPNWHMPLFEHALDPCMNVLQECSERGLDGLVEAGFGTVIPFSAVMAPKQIFDMWERLCERGSACEMHEARMKFAGTIREHADHLERSGAYMKYLLLQLQ